MKDGFSVARFNLHSKRSVDPSSICKSEVPAISATASEISVIVNSYDLRN